MTDTNELIVRFKHGVSEDNARTCAKRAGASVRRRMRTDDPEQVMLLVRVDSGDVRALESRIKGDPSVELTEVNKGGFGPRE